MSQQLAQRIRERKSVIDIDINAQIKHLQKRLVTLCFSQGNNTIEYFNTLGQIKKLREQISKKTRDLKPPV